MALHHIDDALKKERSKKQAKQAARLSVFQSRSWCTCCSLASFSTLMA